MLVQRLKEAALAILPLLCVMLIVHGSVVPFHEDLTYQFLTGCGLSAIGLVLFLIGADVGLIPFGQAVGAILPHSRRIVLVLGVVFMVGLVVAFADPAAHLFMAIMMSGDWDGGHSPFFLAGAVAIIGLFTLMGVARIITQKSMKFIYFCWYALIFVCCFLFIAPEQIGLAIASGGGSIGPVAVALLMALCFGITTTTQMGTGNETRFGLVGLVVAGVILYTVVIMPFHIPSMTFTPVIDEATEGLLPYYLSLGATIAMRVGGIMLPLLVLFGILQMTLIKLPGIKARRMVLGLVYSMGGTIFFLMGALGGLLPTGYYIGTALAGMSGYALIMGVGGLLVVAVVCLEPSIWVWSSQVMSVSAGLIKRWMLMALLCVSAGIGLLLGLIPCLFPVPVWWFLVPGYGLVFLLMVWTPTLYTGAAFDAGSVVVGPLSLLFSLAMVSGLMGGQQEYLIGSVIAFMALIPLITVQLFGIIVMRTMGNIATPSKREGVGV